jgi:hypothetical protein
MSGKPIRYRRKQRTPLVNWDEIDYVVGTRDDVTHTGIKRPCAQCGKDVFTSRRYPDKVPMICEVCALKLAVEERAAERAAQAGKT